MALAHVVRNGAEISEKHVGTDGTHRDESTMLRLDGIAHRLLRLSWAVAAAAREGV